MLKKLHELLFGHFRLKVLALLVALSIWFYGNARVTGELSMSVPIVVEPPAGYAMVHQTARRAQVRVSGPEELVGRVGEQVDAGSAALLCRLGEQEAQKGSVALELTRDSFDLKMKEREFVQLRFRSIVPDTTTVWASPIVEETRPVKVSVTGRPPEGLRMTGPPTADPAQVTVRGPAVALQALSEVPTEEVPIWYMRTGEHKRPVSLMDRARVQLADDVQVTIPVELDESSVVASISITEERLEERTLAAIPLHLRMPPNFPYQVELEGGRRTVSVTVRGPTAAVRAMGQASAWAYVDLTALAEEQIPPGGSGPAQEPVHVVTEDPVSVVEFEPGIVNLTLKNPAR
ncbi:MAG: hypothetical protein PVJ27_03960 [Candidatus Brocadiaceae bacterium]|jgi:hypothetical protein